MISQDELAVWIDLRTHIEALQKMHAERTMEIAQRIQRGESVEHGRYAAKIEGEILDVY
jgi:hypothetical protein